MIGPHEQCAGCGGCNQRAARTRYIGQGDDRIPYFHYFLKCAQCASEIEDERLVSLNGVGVHAARMMVGRR
jgi:hypothetical protein